MGTLQTPLVPQSPFRTHFTERLCTIRCVFYFICSLSPASSYGGFHYACRSTGSVLASRYALHCGDRLLSRKGCNPLHTFLLPNENHGLFPFFVSALLTYHDTWFSGGLVISRIISGGYSARKNRIAIFLSMFSTEAQEMRQDPQCATNWM